MHRKMRHEPHATQATHSRTFLSLASTVVARRVVTTHDIVMEALTCRMRWIRPGVRLGATSVEADKSDGGLGVKAPRMKTSRGSFLGVYRASMWRQTTSRPYTGANTCVMQVGSWRAMSLPKQGRMPLVTLGVEVGVVGPGWPGQRNRNRNRTSRVCELFVTRAY